MHPGHEGDLPIYLDELVDELRRRVPVALHEFDADAIHKSRVATRRLKAALDLFKPVLADSRRKPFAKATRKLRRRLGPLRDLDVMLTHVDEIRAKRHVDAINWVRQRLTDEREAARAQAAGRNGASRVLGKLGAWWGVRDQVIESRDSVPTLLAQSLHEQLEQFAQRADRISNRHANDSPGDATPQDPHELRIAGKRLRYTLELAAAEGHALDPVVFKSFKKMQDALGLWHDLVVLTERVMQLALEHQLHLHEPQMHSKMLDLSRFTLARAQRELNKFGELWCESGQMISHAVREAFAPVESEAAPPDVTESQTDPGPGGSDEPPGAAEPDQGAAPPA